jgi:membrane fusion protein
MTQDAIREPVFRPAAMAARFKADGSGILLTTPPSSRLTAGLSLAVAACLIGFGGWGQLTRTVTVSGQLIPEHGVIRLYPPQPGIVTQKNAALGDRVRRGEPLFTLSSDRTDSAGHALAAEISTSIETRIDTLTAAIATTHAVQDAELARSTQQRDALAGQVSILQGQVASQAETVANDQKLVEAPGDPLSASEQWLSQILSAQRQLASDKMQSLSSELQSLRLRQSLADSDAQLHELPLAQANQIAGLQRQLAQARAELAENEMRREIVVASPQDGTISADLADIGQTVAPGVPLAVVSAEGEVLEARLLVPSAAIGSVHAGAAVKLRYAAYPYQKFGVYTGRVKTVSQTALLPTEIEGERGLPGGEPVYQVAVALAQQTASGEKLRAGMRVDADIDAERRRVWEWIFEPVLAFGDTAGASMGK